MKSLYTFLALILFSTLIFAQTTSVVIDDVANVGSMYYFHGRHVARTPNGLLMVIWTDKTSSGGQIQYSIYDKDFNIWSPGAPASAAAYNALNPGIAADELGNIHATWQERSSSTAPYVIMYSKYNGVSWSSPKKVSLYDAKTCEEPSIEVDSKNNIWIVYNNDGAAAPNEFVFVVSSTNGGTTWSSTATTLSKSGNIGTSITNGRCALSAGPNGKLVAIWHDGQSWNPDRREIFANQYDGTTWAGEVMISDTTSSDRTANWYPTVAVDKNSNIYAFYHTNDKTTDPVPTRYVIMQKKGWGQNWTQSVNKILHAETAGDMLSTSAVADEDGIIHFAFRKDVPVDTTGIDAIYYTFSKDGGNNWSPHLKLGRPNHDGGYVTIANRVRKQYGIDLAFRESKTPFVNDESTTTIIHVNIPYSFVTDIEKQDQLPDDFELLANYPNPFNPSTTIDFKIATVGNVKLSIYDLLGREVKVLVNDVKAPGYYKVTWNGSDTNNKKVTSGIYFATMETIKGRKTIKMELLK